MRKTKPRFWSLQNSLEIKKKNKSSEFNVQKNGEEYNDTGRQ